MNSFRLFPPKVAVQSASSISIDNISVDLSFDFNLIAGRFNMNYIQFVIVLIIFINKMSRKQENL